MTWTTIPTKVTSDPYTASMWNVYNRDNMNHLASMGTGGSAFSALAADIVDLSRIAVGSYTGNGANRNITGIGFDPVGVLISQNTGGRGAFKWFSGTGSWAIGGTVSWQTVAITGLITDGFSLGTYSWVNQAGATYDYICWG